MASGKTPPPKASDPEWLRNAGVRADEFARQARAKALPPAPSAPEGCVGDSSRRRLVTEAGTGLNYEAVASKSSPSELAAQTLALTHAVPASFSPQRHVFYVLGRPCVVPRSKNQSFVILGCHSNPEPTAGMLRETPIFSQEKRIVIMLQSLSPPPGSS